jgi:4-aminobutyrate aminotransferase-like enzyme
MHGHTYQVIIQHQRTNHNSLLFQANPLSCAAALAVQKEIAAHDLLANCRTQGQYLESLLQERLHSANALARPFTFDIRGGGGFWYCHQLRLFRDTDHFCGKGDRVHI